MSPKKQLESFFGNCPKFSITGFSSLGHVSAAHAVKIRGLFALTLLQLLRTLELERLLDSLLCLLRSDFVYRFLQEGACKFKHCGHECNSPSSRFRKCSCCVDLIMMFVVFASHNVRMTTHPPGVLWHLISACLRFPVLTSETRSYQGPSPREIAPIMKPYQSGWFSKLGSLLGSPLLYWGLKKGPNLDNYQSARLRREEDRWTTKRPRVGTWALRLGGSMFR